MLRIKKAFSGVWHFIWNDNSVWSWIVNIILAFLLIKFIVYPVIGFAMGTSHPIVAVISESMEHEGNFDLWWTSSACNFNCAQSDVYTHYNITKEEFLKFRMHNGFNTGDIIILRGINPEKIEKGMIIVFDADGAEPIIHRVVNKWSDGSIYRFTTKGDHNQVSLIKETDIPEDKIIGVAVIRVPYLGYIKIWFVDYIVKPVLYIFRSISNR
ncbi:MAG: signal peptidase I [Candidatus Woesearchaeota archaeon]|nr:signal peptidase I [Candidatus Woesearchaeota archaeon]